MLIQQLTIETARLSELKDFYSRVLELPLQIHNQEKIVLQAGHSELVFIAAGKADPVYHFAFNIPANKIGEAKSWLKDKKIELLWMEDYKSDIADFVNWHAKSVYFFDPAGNIVELIARFDLDNAAGDAFSSKQILSISEAGLVFPAHEFDKRTDDLLQQYQLSYFAKQPPLPQFRAVGDDEGLFVIVPDNRNWFPTHKPSGIFPMKVKFSNGGQEYNLVM